MPLTDREIITMDEIRISELEVFAKHGVFPEENTLGQKFLVNAVLYTDIREAGRKDDIHASVHYGEVCEFITEFMRENTFKLIETVAEHLSREILLKYERVSRVSLEVVKPWAPIGLPVTSVSVAVDRGWHTAYLSIGSNLEDRGAHIENAISSLEETDDIRVVKRSSIIETEPYGKTDQPGFLNGAIEIKTLYTPHELLDRLHEIENAEGRVRKEHWGPRTLDLDILFYDNEIIYDDDLVIPHPDLHNREFVLAPMCEIAPNCFHPLLKCSVAELRKRLAGV